MLGFSIYARWLSRRGSILAWLFYIRTLIEVQRFQKHKANEYKHAVFCAGVPKSISVFIYAHFLKSVIVHLAFLCVYDGTKVSWHHTLQVYVHISVF